MKRLQMIYVPLFLEDEPCLLAMLGRSCELCLLCGLLFHRVGEKFYHRWYGKVKAKVSTNWTVDSGHFENRFLPPGSIHIKIETKSFFVFSLLMRSRTNSTSISPVCIYLGESSWVV